jgi:hypothetical protein
MQNPLGSSRFGSAVVVAALASSYVAAAPALKPWSTNTHPSDVAKTHAQDITESPYPYEVVQRGTMDGRNSRSPMGCGINREGAYVQTWESNRSVRMENVGDEDVTNPWLSNGRNMFRNVQEIVASAITPGMTEAEKAYALWFQQIQYRHHSSGDNNELGDPVKLFNIYGFNTCGNDSIALATLWRAAGLKVAPARALGHCISQAYHDGGWHFYDGDLHSVYLLRDNETVAGEQDIVRDHDLIKRTHSHGILFPDTWWSGQGMCAIYFYEGKVTGDRTGHAGTTMNMVLRPGEALVWRWGQIDPLKHHGALHTMPAYESTIYNGLWEYRPDFSKAAWRKGATSVENIISSHETNPLIPSFSPTGGEGARRAVEGDSSNSRIEKSKPETDQSLLTSAATINAVPISSAKSLSEGLAAQEGKKGTIIWTLRAPYVLVGGRIEAEGAGAKFSISADGKTWEPVTDSLDKFFSTVGPARYEYKLRCELQGPARLRRLAIINDLQMAPMALPEMAVGENAFSYSDQSPGGQRKVRITHEWVERSASHPPAAPTAPIYPVDGGTSEGTDIVFQWNAAVDPDTDAIGDYHFELSNRADMRWPLSMTFYKLVSKTADGAEGKATSGKAGIKAQYTLPEPGLLTPDRRYYWRVRAMDSNGLWGPWSKTWSFTARGPAYPVNVKFDYNSANGVGVLRWTANPAGRRPVKYRIYGSDEKGFTIADKPHQGTVGITKQEMAAWNPWFPANFIAEIAGTELAVMGSAVKLPAANKTYYRVVAVDEQGKCSGPSEYATGPRPVIYSTPVVAAKVGDDYHYAVFANRSLGDLSARMKGGQQISGYFDIENPKFKIERGPAWLKIDENTGVLSGTPDAAGQTEVMVTAHIKREVRNLDEPTLKWGNEKILSVTTEPVGTAAQKFVIDVQ